MLIALGLFLAGLVFPPLLLGAFVAFLIGLREYNAYKTWQKGFMGEFRVIDELYIPSSVLLSDIHLPGRKGNVDHVLVSPKGIFVLETKNYSGEYWVNGEVWKTRGYMGRRRVKVKIRSPAVEVQKEVKAVSSFLKRKVGKDYQLYPLIVLTGDANVHGIKTSEIPILHLEDVPKYIDNFPTVLTQEDVSEVSQALGGYAAHVKDMRGDSEVGNFN
ncbi:nuclease-related domain-containing protein [Thermococcus radiotolerans]|nr:nuclease-related domain-containing protein [Thermococcus radiotolerans]